MQTIENDQFKVEVNEVGAELTHLTNKNGNFDYIWNNDLWPKHAPVLFPAIGRSADDSYTYNGQTYEMPQHGFVSDQTFTVTENTGTALTLTLAANGQTRKYFPFDFELSVTFALSAGGLKLNFDVKNAGTDQFGYSIGSHPAFNLPIDGDGKFSDYQIEFAPKQDALAKFEIIKTPAPYRTGEIMPVENFDAGVLHLDYAMFEAGLVIIENAGLQSLTLSSKKSQHSISVTLDDFRYVCLWTKEGAQAPFLCIEPFEGLPDVAGKVSDLLTKEANDLVAAGQTRSYSYQISLK